MLKWVKTHTYWSASLSVAFLTLHFLHYFLFRFYWQPWATRWPLPQLGLPLPSRSSTSHVCNLSFYSPRCLFECRWRSEGWRHPQAFPSIYPSQETPPPKVKLFHFLPSPAASWETALTSVSTQTNTQKTPKGCVRRANVVVWFTCSAVRAPSLRAGLPHQTLPLTGRRTLVSLTPQTGTRRHGEHAVSVNVRPFWSCFCIPSDVDLDAVVSSTERLSHPTASRPRVTDRRPRSQIITPVSSSHPFSAIIHEIIAIGSCSRSRFRPKHLFCVSRSPLCPVSI